MRPSPFVEAMEAGRHDGEARRHADERALREAEPERVSMRARVEVAFLKLVRRDHSLTDFPCRLSDGSVGRLAVVLQDGDYTLVCRVA